MSAVLDELDRRARSARSVLDRRGGEASAAVARAKELLAEIERFAAERETADRVSGVLSSLGSERDAAAREQIEQLVTAGLKAIFDDKDVSGETLSFHLIESQSRQTTQIDFVVRTHSGEESFDTDVLSARGGGLAAVVGLLLRVVLILLTRATGARAPEVLVLDETLSHLSREYLDRAGQFLATLARSSGLQILMVTHAPELAEYADVTYRFALNAAGVTSVARTNRELDE